MTIDEFFERLPKDGWELSGSVSGKVRRDGCCPLEVVAGVQAGGGWLRSAKALGMPSNLAQDIVDAADDFHSFQFSPALRSRLLQHCGLTKQ